MRVLRLQPWSFGLLQPYLGSGKCINPSANVIEAFRKSGKTTPGNKVWRRAVHSVVKVAVGVGAGLPNGPKLADPMLEYAKLLVSSATASTVVTIVAFVRMLSQL